MKSRKSPAMAPQSNFLVVAAIDPDRIGALRTVLATMNHRPGVVDPQNALVPFGKFDRLHFARFVILDDANQDDITAYGLPRPGFPVTLAFLGDCDGSTSDLFAELVRHAGPGLRQVFSHCRDFNDGGDLLAWLRAHNRPAGA